MDDIYEERRKRLNELLKYLNIKGVRFAERLGKKPSRISNLLNGHKKISADFAIEVAEIYEWLNPEWLISGIGEMKRGESNQKINQEINIGEPPASLVSKLYEQVIERYQPEPLSAKQDLALREACYRVMVENPGQPWAALVIGAGVYLRFIETIPGVEIPAPRRQAENQPERGE